MSKKRILVMITAFAMLLSITVNAQSPYLSRLLEQQAGVDKNIMQQETVLIVEVEPGPAVMLAGDSEETALLQAESNLSAQSQVQEEMAETLGDTFEVERSYTTVFNGFSVKVDNSSEKEAIKELPGVVDVYERHFYTLPEPDTTVYEAPETAPQLATSTGMIGAPQLYEAGYDGTGQVIAVIDSELDVEHEMFQTEPQNPKYSKEDIAALLEQPQLHFNLDVDDVYRSAKIPFAYDYVQDSTDLENPDVIHGTRVSGITAGKDGLGPDGKTQFSGVAPEAQILFFKVFAGEYASDDIILEAVDDAVKMGVSAINMSLGADYQAQTGSVPFGKAVTNARKAGVYVACAAGNATMGYKDAVPNVEHIEYSAGGTPSNFSAATSVAGSANSCLWLNKFTLKDGTEVPFTEGSGQTKFS